MKHSPSVLIVEDTLPLQETLRIGIESMGIAVNVAKDVVSASRAVAEQEPAIVLLDILLPNGNGIDFLRSFRTRHPTIPVIVLTNLERDDIRQECSDIGIQGYVVKSNISMHKVREMVRNALAQAKV